MAELEKSKEEILSSLSQARSFTHLAKDKLLHLASLGKFRRFHQGSTILSEGSKNRDLFFLLKGSVSVYSAGKFITRYDRAGDIFGEMSVISEDPVSATVVTNEDVEVIVIDGGVVGGFQSSQDNELVTIFYKLFSLSLLEKLRVATLKARMFEDAVRHAPLQTSSDADEFIGKSVEKQLNDTLLTSLAVHTAEQAIIVTDAKGKVVRFNLAAENLFSMIELQIRGKPIEDLCERESYLRIYPKLFGGEISSWAGEISFKRGDGHIFPARASLSVVQDLEGQPIGMLSIVTDISREKQLEDQLRQAQKMEAVGQLAGGMAHDFNNLLQIITSYAQLALKDTGNPEKMDRDLNAVLDAAKRGSSLTHRLLAFSRSKHLTKKDLHLNDVMRNMDDLLRRVLGEHITLKVLQGEPLWNVRADANSIEQVMTNLCLNARDAMPMGGVLTLETGNIEIDEAFCNLNLWAQPGRHVMLSVADSGEGMDAERIEHIFEPFFTTKEPGQGTGLGLSMVLGIVEEHDGFLNVESQQGAGTTVTVYLPVVEAQPAEPAVEIPQRPSGGTETILVAEDELDIRIILERVLSEEGYSVLTASDGVEAEEIFAEKEDSIDLVLLDAIMPRKNGKELFQALRMKNPDLPVLFITGYSVGTIGTEIIESKRVRLIRKPFSPSQMLMEVRSMLDSTPGRGG